MKNQSFRKRVVFALNGIGHALKSERSFRTQSVIAALVIITMIVLKASPLWTALLSLAIGAALAMELFNTSLEYLLDCIHPEHHPLIGKAKDCAAAAVLVLSFAAIVIFLAFLYEKIT